LETEQAGFADLFLPKLITVLREGYDLAALRADALAGLTVAIVALPLSMAIAIASGGTPAQGLTTAIVGGFLVSLLGGSRFQIGGPAGAFIVLVAATVQMHGMDGLILATLLSGVLLMAVGLLRLGSFIKFVPYPVTVGFTAGIAVIILASQIRPLLGLALTEPEPGPLAAKIPVLIDGLPSLNATTVGIGVASVVVILGVRRFLPRWPGMLIAVAGLAAASWSFGWEVETIGSVYGGIPSGLPMPSLPTFSFEKVLDVLPSAVSFTLLGSIESLLSAVVADGMTGRRHRSNCELLAQGVANIGSSLFGGMCVTGTIARTATNVRAGARGPIAGMLHSIFLLAMMMAAAPLFGAIPLAALAGVLVVVAWNMVERQAIATLLSASRGDAAVLLITFGLTIFRDLTEAIVVGFALGSVLFIHRMSRTTAVDARVVPLVAEDMADDVSGDRDPYEVRSGTNPEVVVFRISGAFFFGAAASIGGVLDRIGDGYRRLVIDFSAVPFIDSTAAHTIEGLAHKAQKNGIAVVLTGAAPGVRRDLEAHGVLPPLVTFADRIEDVS
jgi:SulP family sulfate permease